MNSLKQLLKKNIVVYKTALWIWNILRGFSGCWIELIRLIGVVLRKIDLIESRKYKRLKQFKNKHPNDRCFIVCTGPSLTLEDLEKIKNEICFSMNSIIKSLNKTAWRPIYYGIHDIGVYKKLEPQIQESIRNKDLSTIFIGSHAAKKFEMINDSITYQYPILTSLSILTYSMFALQRTPHNKFSVNIYENVYAGGSVTYAMLQIAVYMGFKEIYLLGCDCDYSGEKQHFVEYQEKRLSGKTFERDIVKVITSYQSAKQYADSHGIKIYNATRGGKLEVFERVDLDEVLKQKLT